MRAIEAASLKPLNVDLRRPTSTIYPTRVSAKCCLKFDESVEHYQTNILFVKLGKNIMHYSKQFAKKYKR